MDTASLALSFPLAGVIPLLGVLSKLRALGKDTAPRFLLRDVVRIKYLAAPCVRNEPNLEPIPISLRYV